MTSLPKSLLPPPRQHPLKPGSNRENVVRTFIEDKLLEIQRRYAKRYIDTDDNDNNDHDPDNTMDTGPSMTTPTERKAVRGYFKMEELVVDVEKDVEVIWLSGSRKLRPLPAVLDVLIVKDVFVNIDIIPLSL
jgi:hypothetical protein